MWTPIEDSELDRRESNDRPPFHTTLGFLLHLTAWLSSAHLTPPHPHPHLTPSRTMPGPAATTGLAASAGSAYDSTTAPIASSLDPQVVGQLMVRLDKEIKAGKAVRPGRTRGSACRADVTAILHPQSVDLDGLMEYQRVANYLSAAQIFLRSNALLTRPLEQGDIKKRLLGHWGSCPGINFMYAHTNYLITKHDGDEGGCPEFVFVTGVRGGYGTSPGPVMTLRFPHVLHSDVPPGLARSTRFPLPPHSPGTPPPPSSPASTSKAASRASTPSTRCRAPASKSLCAHSRSPRGGRAM